MASVELHFAGEARGAVAAAAETRASMDKVGATAKRTNETVGKSAHEASGRVRELVKTYGALIGVVAGAEAVKTAIEDWENLFKVHRQLDAQLRANKESIQAVDPWVSKLNMSFEKLGFTNAETEDAFTKLDRASGSAAVAFKYMGVTADLARARHIDFGMAGLLVGKIIQGNTAALNRYGIIIPKGTSAVDALAIVHQKLAGQAKAAVTPMEQLKATITDMAAKVGGQLVESTRKYLVEGANWLGQAKNQHEILKTVHQVVDAITTAIEAAVPWIKRFADGAGAVARAVGGWKEAFGIILSGYLALKIVEVGRAVAAAFAVMMDTNPIVLALAAIGATAFYVITHWEQVKRWFREMLSWAKENAPYIGAALGGPFGFAAGEVIKHWRGVKDWFSNLWTWLQEKALWTVSKMIEPFTHLPSFMGGWAKKAKHAIDDELWNLQYKAAFESGQKAANAFGTQLIKGLGPYFGQIQAQTNAALGMATGTGGSPNTGGGSAGGRMSPSMASVVTSARSQVGIPYKTGAGRGTKLGQPTDCSGLIRNVYAANGISIPGTSQTQWKGGRKVTGPLEPGDLLFYNNHLNEANGQPGHVTMYLGDGLMIEDPHTGGVVQVVPVRSDGYMGARRYLPESAGLVPDTSGKKGGAGGKTDGKGGTTTGTGPPGRTTLPPQPKTGKKGKRGTYSYEQLRSLWGAAGGDVSVADIMAAIAVAESSGRSWATNVNSNGTVDYGCWQINSSHGYDAGQLLAGDQSYNARCAVAVYDSQGLGAWSTYTNGAYQQYMHGNNSPKSSGAAHGSPSGDIALTKAQQAAARRAAPLLVPAALTSRITTLATRASALGNTGPQAKRYLEQEYAALEQEKADLEKDLVGTTGKTRAKIVKALDGVKDKLIKVHQEILDAVIITGDALLPANLRARLAGLQSQFKAESALASVKTGKAAADYSVKILTNMREQSGTYAAEVVALNAKLKRSSGRQKTAIQEELAKVQASLASVNDQILSALEASVQADQANVSSVFATVKAKMDTQFEAQTKKMMDALGVQFFQGGVLTPAEQALKAFQDAQQQKSLQDALAAATTPEEKQAAQDAITQDQLQAAATAERTAADKAYAEATQKLEDERAAKEQQMNDDLDKLLESILNGTASVADLGQVAAKYGIVITDGAIPEMQSLTDATTLLAKAFKELIDWISKLTGNAPGAETGGVGNPTDPTTGDSVWTLPGWWGPGLAKGGKLPGRFLGRADTMVYRGTPGETVIDRSLTNELERMVRTGGLGGSGGDTHFHITSYAATPEAIRRELERMVYSSRVPRIQIERRS